MDDFRPFDRMAVKRHRNRAAANWPAFDFLKREVAGRLIERLEDMRRDFPLALDLGCHGGELADLVKGSGKVGQLVQMDLAPAFARLAGAKGLALAGDEEALPFGPAHFDLILSALSLHWVNDLPGTLAQIAYSLKPDGLFLAALLGGETLAELRQALYAAEEAEEGGVSPRISPFLDIRDAGALLQRAGFALPVADMDAIPVSFASALSLAKDLRGMGEANAQAARCKNFSRRTTVMEALANYPTDDEGRIEAEFQVIYLTAWKPHDSQQKPLKPGSAKASLAAVLEKKEG